MTQHHLGTLNFVYPHLAFLRIPEILFLIQAFDLFDESIDFFWR
jgi:hypothetical protein